MTRRRVRTVWPFGGPRVGADALALKDIPPDDVTHVSLIGTVEGAYLIVRMRTGSDRVFAFSDAGPGEIEQYLSRMDRKALSSSAARFLSDWRPSS